MQFFGDGNSIVLQFNFWASFFNSTRDSFDLTLIKRIYRAIGDQLFLIKLFALKLESCKNVTRKLTILSLTASIITESEKFMTKTSHPAPLPGSYMAWIADNRNSCRESWFGERLRHAVLVNKKLCLWCFEWITKCSSLRQRLISVPWKFNSF